MVFMVARPAGWTEHEDTEGREFYFNSVTGVSTYEHPVDNHYRAYYLSEASNRDVERIRAKQASQAPRSLMADLFGPSKPPPAAVTKLPGSASGVPSRGTSGWGSRLSSGRSIAHSDDFGEEEEEERLKDTMPALVAPKKLPFGWAIPDRVGTQYLVLNLVYRLLMHQAPHEPFRCLPRRYTYVCCGSGRVPQVAGTPSRARSNLTLNANNVLSKSNTNKDPHSESSTRSDSVSHLPPVGRPPKK